MSAVRANEVAARMIDDYIIHGYPSDVGRVGMLSEEPPELRFGNIEVSGQIIRHVHDYPLWFAPASMVPGE
jgi:hypothetical protein